MPTYRRVHDGPSYFFTVVTHYRRPILVAAEVRSALRNAIAKVRARAPFTIDAMVLLPDHLHCIWTLPEGDTDYPARWQMIKTIVTQRCRGNLEIVGMSARREVKHQATLWQSRYWEHRIRNDDDFARHVDYIHVNPLKHGLVARVADWPYSSFHRYVRDGRLPIDWAGAVDTGQFGE
jgi:putative transposase